MRDPWPRLTAMIKNTRADLRQRRLEVDETMDALNEADYRNLECLVEYQRRKLFGFRYPDVRGDLTGPIMDQHYAMKAAANQPIAIDLWAHKHWKNFKLRCQDDLVKRASNVFFLRKQAY